MQESYCSIVKQCYFKYLISVILIFIAACEDQNRVSLYSVNQTTPSLVETGDTVKIYGEGFVEGNATVTLNGAFKKSGSFKPVKQSIALKGTAISSSEIQIYISKEIMTKISDDTVDFTGITKVSFPSVLKESVVSLEASGPVQTIRFSPLGEAVKSRAKNLRESLDILKMTGVIVNKENLDSDIEVSKVITGSLANINNIEPGDILISIDSFPANEINELAGLNLKKPHLFEFTSKKGKIKKIYGKIGESTPFQRDEFVAVLLTSLALGLFFALIIPAYIKSSGIPVKHLQNPISNGAGAFFATLLILLFVSFTLKRGEQLLSSIILLSLSALMSLTILIFSKQKILLRFTDFIIQMSALLLLFAGGIYFAKSPGLIDIVNSQGGSHFAFFIWRNPFVMVCGILAISLLWPVNIIGKNQTPVLLIAAWIISATGAMIVTAFLLGGWILPGDPYTLDWTTTSVFIKAVLVFTVKTWLVIGASRLISGANRIERRINADSSRGYFTRWALMLIFAIAAYFLEKTHLPQGLIFAQQVLSGGIFFSLLSLLVFKKLIIFYPKNRGAALKIIHKKIIRA